MDPLTQQLLSRQLTDPQAATAPPQQGAPLPVTPPNPAPKLPSEAQRFANAQQIQQAYRGDWTPNPVLLRASLGK